jgi:hypothetical protein
VASEITGSLANREHMGRMEATRQVFAALTVTLRRPPRIDTDFRRMPNVKGQDIRCATEIDWSPYGIKEGQVSDDQ